MTSITAVSSGLTSPLLGLLAEAAGAAAAPSTGAGRTTTGGGAGAKATTAKAPASKASAARKTATARKTTTAKKPTTAKAGYATRLPADYAFLRDPKLSIEEKLSRFIGLLMTKSEQDLLRQMEKMAPGSTAATGGTGSAGGTGSTGGAAKPKAKKTSLWSIAKGVFPALNLASKVVGDAQLKQLAGQLSGPVLAAAATAVGLPQLAPVALKLGPQLVGALTKDITVDLGLLTGGSSGGATGGTGGTGSTGDTGGTGSSGSTGTSSGTKAGAADGSTSEKAQLLELQRLQDRDKELFSLFSNMLKAMHDARMTSIQNIR